MHTCWRPHPSLVLRWWPLIAPGEADVFLNHGEPDGDPQAVFHIGFEELSEAERWPEKVRGLIPQRQYGRNKVESQHWGFPPDGLDPLMEERQRARRTRGKTRARLEQDMIRVRQIESLIACWKSQQEGPVPGAPFQRTFYVSPGREDVERACFLMAVWLFQAGLSLLLRADEYDALREWAARYLNKQWHCTSLGHAYTAFDTIIRHMVGNEHWKASGQYINRVVKSTRDSHGRVLESMAALEPEEAEGEATRKKQGRPHFQTQKQLKVPYSVDDVVRILIAEGNGQWVPSCDTLYDWINKGHRWYGKVSTIGDGSNRRRVTVTEGGLKRVCTIVREEREHRRLREEGKARGMPHGVFKKLLQRKKTPDGTPDWRAIETHIAHYKGKEEAREMLSLEDKIAEYKAQLAEATPGSDEWCDALDVLERLRQCQRDSDT